MPTGADPAQPMTAPPPDVRPPTVPGALGPMRRKSIWPTVIGVLGVVFGTFASIGGVLGILALLFVGAFSSSVPAEDQGMFRAVTSYLPMQIVSTGISMLLGILLLIGGIMLLARRPGARRIYLAWSVLKILYVFGAATLQWYTQQAQAAVVESEMSAAGTQAPVSMGLIMGITGLIGAIIMVAWGSLFPIFNLIWFSRLKIRNEVQTWATLQR